MGRPKKEESKKKTAGIRVRLTQDEHQLLQMYAEKEGVSMSELLRQKAIASALFDIERTVKRYESN